MCANGTEATTDSLEFGLLLSHMGDQASPEAIERLSRAAQRQGFDAIWGGDHITFPVDMPETYPFSSTGEPPEGIRADTNLFEMFQTLTYVAAVTTDIRVGTNVCLAPLRHPVLATKQALTLEAFADGGFEFGVSVGWLENEYDVMNVPYDERGSRLDEFLGIFSRARTEGILAHEGEHFSFEEIGFYPIPDEQASPRIWIGGKSSAAFRRVAEFGDGWTIVRDRPEQVAVQRDRLVNAWNDYERQGTPGIAVCRPIHVGSDGPVGTDRILVGDPDDVRADLADYRDAGTTHFVVTFFVTDVEKQIEQIERIGDSVIPAFQD
jgi:probable F420-dependent oxidoreductase